MMTSGYAKTNLDEQERIIADWMAQHNLTSADVTAPNSQIKPKPWRCFSISANPASAPKAGVTVTELPKPVTAVQKPTTNGKKAPTNKQNIDRIGKYKPYRGNYGALKGTNMREKIIALLTQHDYVDIDAVINEHKLNRTTFLQSAKQLEKMGILRIIKSPEAGNPAKYLECVA